MKKVLFGTTALVLSAGVAAADITLNGNGRMGVENVYDSDAGGFSDDLTFESRIRINFAASGETDGGLSFGGSLASDDSGDTGTAGSVFIEGSFGKLSMGDVDGAAEQATGDVSGVGFACLGCLNESSYIANGDLPNALYEYSMGDLAIYASAGQQEANDKFAVGASYSFGDFTVGLGYESADNQADDHVIGALSAAFGDATAKVVYGELGDLTQVRASLDYVMGATTATVFYADDEISNIEAWGIGASYDLGGGASLKGGYVAEDITDTDGMDFGITMSF